MSLKLRSSKGSSGGRPAWVEPTARAERPKPWDLCSIPHHLHVLQTSTKNDQRLHAAATIRKCCSEAMKSPSSSLAVAEQLAGNTMFIQTVCWLLCIPAEHQSPTVQRVQVHIAHSLRSLVGVSETVDVTLCHDVDVLDIILQWVLQPPSPTSSQEVYFIMMELVTTLSKRESNQPLLCHYEGLVQHYVHLLSTSSDGHIVFHCLHTLSNLSENPRNHYALSRNSSLLRVTYYVITSCDDDAGRAMVGLRMLNHLMSYPENCNEVIRSVPEILEQLIRLSSRTGDKWSKDQIEITNMATCVLELAQDFDPHFADDVQKSLYPSESQVPPTYPSQQQQQYEVKQQRPSIVPPVIIPSHTPTTTATPGIPSPQPPSSVLLVNTPGGNHTNPNQNNTYPQQHQMYQPPPLPESSEELQQFIDRRIKSLEALYGTAKWAVGPNETAIPKRW
eukprot:PhF_6_TR40692/c0_g1_i2/m.61167